MTNRSTRLDGLNIESVRAAHHNQSAREHLHHHTGGAYIKDIVYGANDGIITTFAVVAGVAGASIDTSIVLILGFANLFADAVSMAAGNFLGSRSERDFMASERAMEAWEVDHVPDEEKAELRQIYELKGFHGADLDRAVEIIAANKTVWVDEMMRHELGLNIEADGHPAKNALATWLAFMAAGTLPLLPFLAPWFRDSRFTSSIVMTIVALFVVGSARTRVTRHIWWKAGLEMLAVGAVAASVAYGIMETL